MGFVVDRRKKKRKLLLGFMFVFLGLLATVGGILAYFSDVIWQDVDITNGTLSLSAVYSVTGGGTINEGTVTNLAPGDVIVVGAAVTNNGSLSAWVRELVSFDTEDADFFEYLEVYRGEFTAQQIIGGAGAGALLDLEGTSAASGARVLNGAGGTTESGGGFEYIGSNQYSQSYTVFFKTSAPNALQNSALTVTVATQAIQFANNNAAPPSEGAWATVEPATGD